MPGPQPLISVIILNYNGMGFTPACLESVFQLSFDDYEVIVVDNGSTDGSADWVAAHYGDNPRLSLLRLGRNLGFAEGNNAGARRARGRYLFILNNDTRLDPGCLGEIARAMQSDDTIGAGQCKLLQMDSPGKLESVGHWIDTFGLAHVLGQDETDEGQYDQTGEIFGATGAAMVVSRACFEEVGGFDGSFFIFFEESDLCWRIWLRGYRIISIPKARVFHKGGGTVRQADVAWRVYLFTRNRTTSMLKNYSLWNLLRYMPMNVLAVMGFSLLFGVRGAGRLALAVARALLWNLVHLPTVWRKRRAVQRLRRVSDAELFRRGVIRPFRFSASARDGLYKSSAPWRKSGRYLG